ncbi:MAG: hypothetical protein PWQ96_1803 [Clostridia bacterium]|nr:hypothetical protein [Clostridia bacterium]
MILSCLLLVLTSCAVNTEDINTNITEENKQSEEQLQKVDSENDMIQKQITPKIEQDKQDNYIKAIDINTYSKKNDNFIIKEIIPRYDNQNFVLEFSDCHEENLLIGLSGRNEKVPELILLRYDLKTGSYESVYEGAGRIHYNTNLKTLNNSKLAFQCQDKVLILESNDFKVLSEIKLPEGVLEYDISYDGTKIAYSQKEGLFVSNLDFSNRKILLKSTGKEELAKRPGQPKWSYDDKNILYISYVYQGSEGVGVINLDGSENQFYEIENALFAYWLDSSNKILCGQDEFDETESYIINLTKNEITPIELDKTKRYYGFMPNTLGQKVAYAEEVDIFKSRICIFDEAKLKYCIKSPILGRSERLEWSTSAKQIIITTINKKDEGYKRKIILVEINNSPLIVDPEPRKENGNILTTYHNDKYGYSFDIPKHWEGKYEILEKENKTYFLYTGCPGKKDQFLTIISWTTEEFEIIKETEDNHFIEDHILAKTDNYIFYATTQIALPFESSEKEEKYGDDFSSMVLTAQKLKTLFHVNDSKSK